MLSELDAATRLAIAGLVGLAVGIEREWSGHSRGTQARFAGVRTFLMIGLASGVAGILLHIEQELAAAALLLAVSAIAIVAYAMTVRRSGAEIDGTTEVAALVVVALGSLAGVGYLALAAGVGAIVVLVLSEKERMHKAVAYVREDELQAALRFSVLALVVLPLLPQGPVFGTLAVRPRLLWIIVLVFSAINFGAFIARRAAGSYRGYGLAGMLGGLFSSTAVTFEFSRRSRQEPEMARSLAAGVVGACVVLMPRVLVASAVLNPRVSLELMKFLFPALLLGAIMVARDWRSTKAQDGAVIPPGNPLRLGTAIRMAALFQVAIFGVDWMRSTWNVKGLYATSAALGLTDVDALTVAMSRPEETLAPELAARAIAVGILANTAMKSTVATVLGGKGFRSVTVISLLMLGTTIVLALRFL